MKHMSTDMKGSNITINSLMQFSDIKIPLVRNINRLLRELIIPLNFC